MSTPAKRPYVRPRVGHSMLRSLWYLFAFAGLLVVAFLLPREPAEVTFQGRWQLLAAAPVSGWPAGSIDLSISGDSYMLRYQAAGDGDPAEGMEMGDVPHANDHILLRPRHGAYRLSSGVWTTDLPAERVFGLRQEGSRLILTAEDGSILAGQLSP